ncbi:MAG TPA: trypsin-like serine protease, partial [Pseudobdellovibrionaceae bacterium]|nr:trypsin-like serine protease [Pseudobdellovibrionaceae bacterium]
MHEGYDPEGSAIGGSDLALIKLAKEAPATVETVELKTSETPWTSYDRVLIAGYGRTVGGSSDVEDPRPVSLRAIVRRPLTGDSMKTVREGLRKNAMGEMPETFANMWLDLIFDSSAESEMVWLDQTDKRGACSGDSGGPAFVIEDGKIKQLGVATSVLTGASPEETCLIASNYTNVLKYKGWISENYRTLTGRDASRIFPE